MNLDRENFDIPCPHCAKQFSITVGQAKRNAQVICPSCRRTTNLEQNQFRREIAKVEKALTDLQRQLGKLFK